MKASRSRVLVAGICALTLTIGLARFAYTPMLPIMQREAGLGALGGGLLATINYAGYMSGALIAASIGDLHRKFTLYRIGLVLAVVATAAMGLTADFHAWAFFRFVAGLSSAAGLLLGSGLVLNWLIRQGHPPELGVHFTGLGLGIVVSGIAVGAMAPSLWWTQEWIGLGILGVAFLLPAWRWMPAPAQAVARETRAASVPPPPSQRWTLLFMGTYFCAGWGFVVGATFIVAILEGMPVFEGRGGWIWVIVGLAAIPSSFLWDRVASAMGVVRALMLAYLLQIVSLVIPATTGTLAANLAAALLFGATFGGIVSLTLALIGRRFPQNPAKAMARMTLSYGVAQIAAPAVTGYLATVTGSYRDALLLSAVVMAAGLVLLRGLLAEAGADHPRQA